MNPNKRSSPSLIALIGLITALATLILGGYGVTATASMQSTPESAIPKVTGESPMELFTKALNHPVRVIVTLKLDTQNTSGQAAIKQAQDNMIAALADSHVTGLKTFDLTPQLAFSADSTTILYLLLSPDVLSIQEDIAVGPSGVGAPS